MVTVPKPNIHYVPATALAGAKIEDLVATPPNDAVPPLPGNALSLRLRELTVLDNFDGIFEGIFGGSNELKLVSLVNDGTGDDPFKFEVGTFPGIKPKAPLPLGDKGLVLYYAEPEDFPKYLDWRLLVVEDDSDVRNAGAMIKKVQGSTAYKDILTAAVGLANPTIAAVAEISNKVIGLIADLMEQNSDDVITLFAATYTRAFDRLGVGPHTFHHDGRTRGRYEILAQ